MKNTATSFIGFIYSNYREFERKNIYNKEEKSFIKRNGRYIISFLFTTFVLLTLEKGYNNDFLELGASILSILIGLFLTTLVLAFDKIHISNKKEVADYKLEIKEKEEISDIEISINKIINETSRDKLWRKESIYYIQKFNILIGKSVIVGVWALALICLNVMYIDFFSINLHDYTFSLITMESICVFFKLLIVVVVRFLICYYMIEVFYNAIRIIGSMINYMSVRINK